MYELVEKNKTKPKKEEKKAYSYNMYTLWEAARRTAQQRCISICYDLGRTFSYINCLAIGTTLPSTSFNVLFLMAWKLSSTKL